MAETAAVLSKVLSANDVGQTGGHQDGVHVPKDRDALAFFPHLDVSEFNPRIPMRFVDLDTSEVLDLNFIYYNGRLLGKSSRNEHRLTPLLKYFKRHGAVAGDIVEFSRSTSNEYFIRLFKAEPSGSVRVSDDDEIVHLSGTWSTRRFGR
jgi:hypothetical protein